MCLAAVCMHERSLRSSARLSATMFARSQVRLGQASMRARWCSSTPVLWHNPACSKSRAALSLLEAHASTFEIREYLSAPPTFAELQTLQRQLGREPIEWVRTMDTAWLEHFDHATIYDDILPDNNDILRAIVQAPVMLERPILVRGDRAVVGRPPERVLSLLDDAV